MLDFGSVHRMLSKRGGPCFASASLMKARITFGVRVPLSAAEPGRRELAVECRFVGSGAGVVDEQDGFGSVGSDSFGELGRPSDLDEPVDLDEVDDPCGGGLALLGAALGSGISPVALTAFGAR